jgi:hypothetical protein
MLGNCSNLYFIYKESGIPQTQIKLQAIHFWKSCTPQTEKKNM